ncbi:MAG: sugar phosphate nucleotidyltransferase, partial [Alphaproteobacteria bacterium]
KPDAATAEQFLATCGYLWNAGIFMMRADDLLTLAKSLQPMMHQHVTAAYDQAKEDLDFLRLDPTAWADVPAESFDYSF